MVSTQQHTTTDLHPGHNATNLTSNDVKNKLKSQASCLAWYQSTDFTFTYRQFFCIIIILFAIKVIEKQWTGTGAIKSQLID